MVVLFREKQEKQSKNMWTEIRKRQYLWGIKLSFFSLSTKEHQPALHYHHNDKNMTIINSHPSKHYILYMLHTCWRHTDMTQTFWWSVPYVLPGNGLFTTRLSAVLWINHCVNIHPLRIVEKNWTPFQWIKLGWHNQFYFSHEAR